MSGKTILYVEDNEANRMIVRDLLKRTKYQLIEAFDGEAGVAMALEKLPDLILMDIQLPKISGMEATRRLRAEPATANSRSTASGCSGVTRHTLVLGLHEFGIDTVNTVYPSPCVR